jgi:AraC family transcriptional activator of pyochelin receptor
MKIVFKSEDFEEITAVREYVDGFEVAESARIKETVDDFDYKGIHSHVHRIYCPGMIVSMITSSLEHDLVHILESDFPYLQMHFELTTTGVVYHPTSRAAIDTEIYAGMHSLLFYPSLQGKLNYLKKSMSYSVEIELSLDFLRGIFNNDLEVLQDFGRSIEQNLPAVMGNRSYPITVEMKQILNQIRDCTYSGSLKRLFIEAKVVELLTLQISQINHLFPQKKALKKQDIDKLNAVRDLLIATIHTPYSIEELAKIAGINRTKLQEGFRELFGTTVFGFITDRRLEEARQRIQDSRQAVSIAEIAAMAGYKNPQHFTVAFKRKFGCLPKDVR